MLKIVVILILSFILTACATLPADQGALNQSMSWSSRKQQLQTITHWQLQGAIAIKTAQQGQTASLSWQQQHNHRYHIDLYGPLGAGRVSLSGSASQVTLLADGKHYQANTPDALMQQILGWQLPVRNLYYWVRGIPAPTLPAKLTFDSFHHLSQLQQQGWHVHYQRYTSVHGVDLPSLLLLQRNDLQVKIVISRWQ